MIVIVEKNKDGKIVVTEEQLKKWLDEARAEGYREGLEAGRAQAQTPSTTSIPPTITWGPGVTSPDPTVPYEPAPWWTNPCVKPLEATCGTTPDATTVPNSTTKTNAKSGSSTIANQRSANEEFNALIKDLSRPSLSNS